MLTRIPLYLGPLPQLHRAHPPWPGQTHRSGAVTLNVRHTPGPQRAELAVYLHGLGGSSTNFTDLAGLVGVRFPGMAIDLPGFGRSAPPDGFDYAPDSHAEVIATFLAGLGHGSVHLVGNSLGGVVALLIAARHPQLVRTLTLLAPAMPDLRMDPRRLSDPRVALTMLPVVGTWVRRILIEVPPEEQVDRMLRLCFVDPSVVASARRAEAVAECVERVALTWAVAALRQSTQQLARLWLMSRSRSLWWVAAQVQAPALVVWGAADKLVTVRKAPRTAAALPRGRLIVLPRTGHLPQMEQPSSVARAILGMIDAVDRAVW